MGSTGRLRLFDATGKVTKTYNAGVAFALVNGTVMATIEIQETDVVSVVPSGEKWDKWIHEAQVIYDSRPLTFMEGVVRIRRGA